MKYRGFTLVELISIIVLLSLLAAVALPRFLNLQDSAELAVVKSTESAFRYAVKIAQVKWRASDEQRNNLALSGSGFINMVDFSQFGCPVQHWAINSEANPSADNSTDCLTVFLLIMDRCENGLTDCGNQPDEKFEHGYLGNGICQYTYRDNTEYRLRYATEVEGCTVTTSGF
ncbi:MAG: MSHA pilin protein MshB [Methylophagaceae bacterium]|jgi:MSHA pilin protein MshB